MVELSGALKIMTTGYEADAGKFLSLAGKATL